MRYILLFLLIATPVHATDFMALMGNAGGAVTQTGYMGYPPGSSNPNKTASAIQYRQYAYRYQAANNGILKQANGMCDCADTSAREVRWAIWKDNTGDVGALKAQTLATFDVNNVSNIYAWMTTPVDLVAEAGQDLTITAGEWYWIGRIAENICTGWGRGNGTGKYKTAGSFACTDGGFSAGTGIEEMIMWVSYDYTP